MARTISIANQKGGVGKTTTAMNLVCALGRSGRRSLLVDLDPQCNATSGLGLEPSATHPLNSGDSIDEFIQSVPGENAALLPGSRSLQQTELLTRDDRFTIHKVCNALSALQKNFDYVVLDLPPTLGRLTRTALAASSEVLIPIQCEYFAMEGLAQMIEVIRDVMRGENGNLDFAGILLTMYDHRLEITHEVDQQVREFFGEIVFQTVIPRDPQLCEAPSHGSSVLRYSPRSRGARAYAELGREVIEYDTEAIRPGA